MPSNCIYGFQSGIQRGWLRPVQIGSRAVIALSPDAIQISFFNRSGGLLGRIRTDVQYPIIKEVSFQRDRSGCGDASLKLFELPPFPIPPFSQVGIRFGRSARDNYRGYLNVDDLEGTTRDEYEFSISGLREQLQRNKVNRIISGPIDVSDVIEDIYDNNIEPATDIRKNPAKLTNPSSVLTTTLDFGKEPIRDAVDVLAVMAGYNTGVDEEGDFYFLPRLPEIKGVFFVGINVVSFQPRKDIEQVKNSIVVQRNKTSGPGWQVATIRQNGPSQAKYGLREEFFKVPGHFDDVTCEVIGDRLLAEKSEPRFAAKSKHYLEDENDLFEPGIYRFISPLDDYTEEVTEADDLAGWTKIGPGDLVLTTDQNIFLTGSGCLRLTYSSAGGDRAEFRPPELLRRQIKKFRFYIRSPFVGAYITLGIGTANWNEYTQTISINGANTFSLVEWDISGLPIEDIGVFAFRIDDTSGNPNTVYIDRIDLIRRDYRFYDLELEKVKYRFNAKTSEAAAEWGANPKELDDYVTQLLAFSRANEFRSEDR